MDTTPTRHRRPRLVFSPLVGMLAAFCRGKGVDPDPTLARLGISPEVFADQEARVPYEALLALWDDLLTAHPDAPLGLEYASMIDMASFGLYALLGMHSATMAEGIRRSIRFQRLFDPELDLRMEVTDEACVLTLRHEVEDTHPEIMEMMLGAMCLYARSALGPEQLATHGHLEPFEAVFKHARRHPEAAYTERTGARVRFGAPRHQVRMPAAWLDLPIAHATPGVAVYLERALLAHERADAAARTFADDAREELSRALSEGEVSQDAIARRLAVSARTLQRRLRKEGFTFAELLEAERRDQAERLLARDDLPVYAIAYALGYSEPSTFHRAFKRWTGETPQSYRTRLTEDTT
jgi:AraC-like DNA-binding protein